ncbi:MAG: hypothetical protein PHO42_02375, partial [Candidatus Omnitrophica bacterium]|nr:hypothetical protein [Candidatus Omnitrophota bacterium]
KWPAHNPSILIQDEITIIVQVNGKVRSRLKAGVNSPEAALKEAAFSDEAVKKWLEGRPVKNFIVVPNKLVNIVV